MDAERWWPPFVEVAALAWIALFVADVADELVETDPFDFLGVSAPSS